MDENLADLNSLRCTDELKDLYSKQSKALNNIKRLYSEIIGSKASLSVNICESKISSDYTPSRYSDYDYFDINSALPSEYNLDERENHFLEVQSDVSLPSSASTNSHKVYKGKKFSIKETNNLQQHRDLIQSVNVQSVKQLQKKNNQRADESIIPASIQNVRIAHKEIPPLNVTVPEPFKMTLREIQEKDARELKKRKMIEKWQSAVKKEINTKIHANPVPVHVHLPLYQRMLETYNKKRTERKENTKEKLKAMVKPFNITEPKKYIKRSSSVPNLNKIDDAKFKAKPIPKCILDEKIDVRLRAEEEIRKLRIKKRAQVMLKQASLPFSGQYSKAELTRSKSLTNLSQKDFDLNNWKYKVTTVCQPFNFKTDELFMKKEKEREMKAYLQNLVISDNFTNRPFSPAPSHCASSLSSDTEIKMTTATVLRDQKLRKQIKEKESDEINRQLEVLLKEKRKLELQRELYPKILANDPTLGKKTDIAERIKSYRHSEKLRQQEYEEELKEIHERVKSRPLLIERQTLNAAKNLIEKQFQEKLQGAGLDLHFVEEQSKRYKDYLSDSSVFSEEEISSKEVEDEKSSTQSFHTSSEISHSSHNSSDTNES